MIRKWIMVILVLSGLMTAVTSGLSFARPFYGQMQLTERAWVQVFALEGLIRFMVYTADKPIVTEVRGQLVRVKTPLGETCTSSRMVSRSELQAARIRNQAVPVYAWRRAFRSQAAGGMLVHHTFVRLPGWVVTTLFLVYPVAGAIQNYRKRKRVRQGECLSCGYDLTGNESGRCPECGRST